MVKRLKSFAFTTDVAVIKNINADAVFAVYPFTPQSVITETLVNASDVPSFLWCRWRAYNGKESNKPCTKC